MKTNSIQQKTLVVVLALISSTFSLVYCPPQNINTVNGLNYSLSGMTITSYWGLKDISNQLECPGGMYGTYTTWSKLWTLGKYGTITFSAIATNDIHVGVTVVNPWNVANADSSFYSNVVSSSNFYEFVIGGWGNGNSAIRKGHQAEPVVFVSGGIPNTSRLIDYQIVFSHNKRKNKDMIRIYSWDPAAPNQRKWTMIMQYEDPSLIQGEQRWFTFSSWDAYIWFTNIQATSSVLLPPTE